MSAGWSQHAPGAPPGVLRAWLVLAAFLLFALVATNLVTSSFEKLGLAPPVVMLLLPASLIGSAINIPIRVRSTHVADDWSYRLGAWMYFRRPRIERQVLAINVGGALVPIALSAWLLFRAPLLETAAATALVAVVSNRLARIVPGQGIAMPALIPPIVAAAAALALSGGRSPDTAAIAYVSGSMGALIGADLLNLHRLDDAGSGVMSIGGAGVFDGVFLVGILAVLLA